VSSLSARRAAAAAARAAVPVAEGEALSDRGSSFQALLAPCPALTSTDTVLRAIAAKALSATTRSFAYRISDAANEGAIVERFDDGGEHGAGERLLQLLQRADVRNVCLVVARWFGGTLLGPDRFKHVVSNPHLVRIIFS
jgi:putative IMPACT (imprinted ancient) family translation regulator